MPTRSRPHQATYAITFSTAADARIIERSITPEVGMIEDDRSRATVSRTGSTLRVTIEAADLVALRAATNTWLSWIESSATLLSTRDDDPPADASIVDQDTNNSYNYL